MSDSPPTPCHTCGIIFTEHKHLTSGDCIRALQTAMHRQKQLAADLGMDMSIMFLRVLEELSIRPEAGYRYLVWDNINDKEIVLPPQQVSGIFSSILKLYKEQADFSPMEEQRKLTSHYKELTTKLLGVTADLLEDNDINEDSLNRTKILMDQIARQLDLSHS